jgi:thiol-disulfide isomerase/thioredoxin
MKIRITLLLLSASLAGAGSALAQTTSASPACEPTPAVRQALSSLPNMSDYRIPYEERMKPLRVLLAKYPRDIFVQQRYQDVFTQKWQVYEEFDRAFAMYRSKPADPVFRYLEARLTGAFHAAKAEEMLNDLIAKEPGFPWPHLAITELTVRPGARDAKKAESHLRAFIAACPSSAEGYARLRAVEDADMIATGAAKLRAILEAKRDNWSLPLWRYLWDLEFRAAPKAEQETVRQRGLRDATMLAKNPPAGTREWYLLFQYAAQLTKDQPLLDWLETTIVQRFPTSPLAASVERTRWSREHSRPPQGSKPEEFKAYQAIEEPWHADFEKRWPNDPDVILDRFLLTLSSRDLSVPLDERLSIVDRYLTLRRQSPDCSWESNAPPAKAAAYYVRWGVRLDEVPAMIQAGLKQSELESTYQLHPTMYPEEVRKNQPNWVNGSYWNAQLALADLYLRQREPDRARDAIQIGLANVELRPVAAPDNPRAAQDAEFRRRSWLPRLAQLAELQGDRQKALAIYQQYLQPIGRRRLSAPPDNTILSREELEVVPRIKTLYLANGGKEESWLDWATATPADASKPTVPGEALEFTVVLPDFEAKDLNGKTWRLADLRGKATFIDVWAQWCGVCRAHHPDIQKLYDAVKGRKDIQVLSFSRDETAYLAESYMKETKYTFPVIASKDLSEKLFPMAGLPMYWIIDAQGRRSSPIYFPGGMDRIIADLERAAAAR